MDAETKAVFDAAWQVVNWNYRNRGTDEARGELRATLQAHAKAHPPELPKKADENRPDPDIMVGDPFKPDITCSKCGAAMHPGDDGCLVDCRCTSKPKVASESRPEPEDSRSALPPLPSEATTKGPETPTEPVKLKRRSPEGREKYLRERVFSMARDVVEAWLELDQSSQDHNPLRHDMVALWTAVNCYDMPRVDPDDNSQDSLRYATEFLQPAFLQPQPGDMCVMWIDPSTGSGTRSEVRRAWEAMFPDSPLCLVNGGSSPGVQILRPAKEVS